jgi:hypothetical protein
VAKKSKTPPPPRRVQVPKARSSKRADDQRTRTIIYGVAGAGIAALLIVLAVMLTGGGSGSGDKAVAAAMKAAGCDFKTVPAFVPKKNGKYEDTHVNSLTAKLKWNTFPPSNGQHYPQWAIWDFYTEAVNPRQVVHNLEHGGVVLWWGPKVPQSTVDKLRALYNEDPVGMFGTPIPGLDAKVAISAWTGDPARYHQNGYFGEGHVAVCPAYTDKAVAAFKKFRDAYRGKGPEGIPLSQDQPGT